MCERPFNMNVEFEWRRISGIKTESVMESTDILWKKIVGA